jgi:hypothetical protein
MVQKEKKKKKKGKSSLIFRTKTILRKDNFDIDLVETNL